MKSLEPLLAAGCRAWIDDLTRRWLDDGTLGRFIDEDGISGVTSNPAIFERAIGSDVAYAAGLTPQAAYESLVGEDLQRAADWLAAVHRDSAGRDGFVSWEVAPEHAYSAESTIDAAQRLWHRLERANGLIKVPATPAGVIAIRALAGASEEVRAALRGQAALAVAVQIYRVWCTSVESARWRRLAAWRRRPTAFHAPGHADGAWADEIMTGFAAQGVSLPDLAETLEIEGVRLFRVAYDRTLAALERRLSAMHSSAGDLSR